MIGLLISLFHKISFSYSNSSKTTIIKKLCKSNKLVKWQSGHAEKPFAGHMWSVIFGTRAVICMHLCKTLSQDCPHGKIRHFSLRLHLCQIFSNFRSFYGTISCQIIDCDKSALQCKTSPILCSRRYT